jgi:hypothetical protein
MMLELLFELSDNDPQPAKPTMPTAANQTIALPTLLIIAKPPSFLNGAGEDDEADPQPSRAATASVLPYVKNDA